MKKYTDLFIDFDDTLYDTHGNAVIALGELFDQCRLDRYFATLEDFTVPYWKANVELWEQYSKGLISRDYLIVERFRRPLSMGWVPSHSAEGRQHFSPSREYCLQVSDRFLDLCACKPGLVDGAREVLEYLRQRYRMHLCSNGFHEVQYRKLQASDTARYFDTIILSEDAGANKPSREFFQYAFSKTGADVASTLMIGDNLQTDIIGAANAGLDTLFFDRWQNTPDAPEATMRVDSLLHIKGML